MAAMLPNGPLQVVFSFDTTGSMSGALTEVRGRVSDMLQRLQTDIPAVTTAVVAHGDYCDKAIYITKHIDFSSNLPELVDFVNNVEGTGGGDEPEAYEVMLRLVRKDLKWADHSQKVLVVIGDAFPHAPTDTQNKDKIDWKKETQLLSEMGVRIYGVQVNSSTESTKFFRTMTEMTDGQHLKLSEFGTLCDVIMAICYREKGAEFLSNYEAEVRAREGRMALHKDLEGVFGVLRKASSTASSTGPPPVTKIPSIRKAPSTTKAAPKKTVTIKAAKKPAPRAVKTSRASARMISTAKREVLPRKLNRELVPHSNFRFNTLDWAPWKLALIPSTETPKGQWRRVLGGAARARSEAVTGATAPRAGKGGILCEAAVQTRPGARRHVVWCRLLPVSSASRLSLSRLLTSPGVRAQLDRVMRSGCRVWVRWAKVSKAKYEKEVKQRVKDMYDYAWCGRAGEFRDVWVPNGHPSHRLQIAGSLDA